METGYSKTVQNFDEFIQRFEDLFKRTISDEEKEEEEFAAEYAELVQTLREFINRSKLSPNWQQTFISMQEKTDTYKKPLRTLDKKGKCWSYVREIQLMSTNQ